MNIFMVDKDPTKCAQALDSLRLNKMILETAQLLSTAYRHLWLADGQAPHADLYKETHTNHPCSVWARKSAHNYRWLVDYFKALHDEWLYRGHTEHTSYRKLYNTFAAPANAIMFHTIDTVTFDFDCSNVDEAGSLASRYRTCLFNKWINDSRKPNWEKRGMPDWLTQYQKDQINA